MTDEGSEVLVIMVSSIGLGEIPTCYLKLIRKKCGVGCGERGGKDDLRLGYICLYEMFLPDCRTDGGSFGGWYHWDPSLTVSLTWFEQPDEPTVDDMARPWMCRDTM